MKLADKIILLRKQKGWSQEDLAAQMDVSRQSVSKWESGASVPDIDKILLLSQIFGTTTDFLLKEEVDVSDDEDLTNNDEKEAVKRYITKQEATAFIDTRKKAAPRMALGVWLCIVSPALLMTMLGIAETNKYGISENMAVAIGLGALFVIVTIAVSLFIINGMALDKYEYIEKEVIIIDAELTNELNEESEAFMPTFTKNIAAGVVLCIVAVIPVVTLSMLENDLLALVSISVLLIIVAFGVYRFVKVGVIKGGYDQILQRDDYTAENKELNKTMEPIAAIYWLTATAIYLAISFTTNLWETTWIIWPVAGVLFAIVAVIVKNKKNKK